MTLFFLDNQRFHAESGETVLSSLKRAGYSHNYSCTKGVCRSCLLKLVKGDAPARAQKGLEPELKAQGLLFACQCVPNEGMQLSMPAEALNIPARLLDKQFIGDHVLRLVLKPESSEGFHCGLCVGLRVLNGDGEGHEMGRTYGIAPGLGEGTIAFHVRRKRNGKFSQWLCDETKVGDTLMLTRPWGRCDYRHEYLNDELIVVAFGTGIGPALGVVHTALQAGHNKSVHLYHWGRTLDDLYLHRPLLKLMLEHRNFFYQGLIGSRNDKERIDNNRVRLTAVPEILKERHVLTRDKRLFIFGEPEMVAQVTEYAFLNALDIERLHSQSFEYRDLRKHPRI
ncbi:2Fe-2S iron-sulfur cluster-binding protein [Shewanella sp.]|uniref:2Fe-2S iron-sulfur cluster-binding protein n=1 Tax=Shewanella sp. TaxID=50422 RepID=UPI0035677D96